MCTRSWESNKTGTWHAVHTLFPPGLDASIFLLMMYQISRRRRQTYSWTRLCMRWARYLPGFVPIHNGSSSRTFVHNDILLLLLLFINLSRNYWRWPTGFIPKLHSRDCKFLVLWMFLNRKFSIAVVASTSCRRRNLDSIADTIFVFACSFRKKRIGNIITVFENNSKSLKSLFFVKKKSNYKGGIFAFSVKIQMFDKIGSKNSNKTFLRIFQLGGLVGSMVQQKPTVLYWSPMYHFYLFHHLANTTSRKYGWLL